MSDDPKVADGTTIVRETYAPNDFIFFEGDIESHFYIVESGKVSIFTKNKAGKKIDILTIEEGESFGEFALLSNAPRSATAQAMTEVTVIKVSEAGYEQLLSELPVWATCMMKSFSSRLKKMNDHLKMVDQFVSNKENPLKPR